MFVALTESNLLITVANDPPSAVLIVYVLVVESQTVLETPATEVVPILSINPDASTVKIGTNEDDPHTPE